jgi:hypothetical protein
MTIVRVWCVNIWCSPQEFANCSIFEYLSSFAHRHGYTLVLDEQQPDVLITSVFGSASSIKACLDRYASSIKLLFVGENAKLRFPAALSPDLHYHGIMSHMPDDDSWLRSQNVSLMRTPLWFFSCELISGGGWAQIRQYAQRGPRLDGRTKVASLVSRSDFFGIRTLLLQRCQAHGLSVDCPGRVGQNMPTIEELGLTKHAFLSQYVFHFCPENSLDVGYITEKLIDAALAGCIPVYWGIMTDEEERIFNTHRIIQFDNSRSESIDACLRRMMELLQSPSDLRAFFEQPVFTSQAEAVLRRKLDDVSTWFGRILQKANHPS